MMNLAPFRELLERMCGLVFENEKTALLETGIRTRMESRAIPSPERYLSLLAGDRDEFGELIDLLTINETYFYREPIHFSLLAERIAPDLLANPGRNGRITLLSAGCSTGEEAYSILISLAERYGREGVRDFTVIGVDIDTNAVSRAREGAFGRRSFRDFPEELLKKYFEETSSGTWRVREWLRESVVFLPFNLLSGEYPPELLNVDVIMYRNVSIYFSQDVRNRIFSCLAGILSDGGYLFTSPSETFFYNRGVLDLIPLDGAFLFRKGAVRVRQEQESRRPCRGVRKAPSAKDPCNTVRHRNASLPPPLTGGDTLPGGSSGEHSARPPLDGFEKAVRHAAAREYEDALRELDGFIGVSPGFCPAHTLKGSILMNLSRLDEARTSYREAQRIDRFSLDASFSLGLIERLAGDDPSALQSLREAIYIHPSCWPAHYFLAETHHERGETEHARREFEVILKILDKGDFLEHGLTNLPFSFSARELETLCRRKLLLLKRVGNGD
jgi:chemotaxis protein methyltransferase CheR